MTSSTEPSRKRRPSSTRMRPRSRTQRTRPSAPTSWYRRRGGRSRARRDARRRRSRSVRGHVVRPDRVRARPRPTCPGSARGRGRRTAGGRRRRAGTRPCRRTPRSPRGCASASRAPRRPRAVTVDRRRGHAVPSALRAAELESAREPPESCRGWTARRPCWRSAWATRPARSSTCSATCRAGGWSPPRATASTRALSPGRPLCVAALCDGPRRRAGRRRPRRSRRHRSAARAPAAGRDRARRVAADLVARARAARVAALRRLAAAPRPLVRSLMQARDAAGVRAPVVALPLPRRRRPRARGCGLAPETGAGNVLEMAAKLAVVAAERAGVGREAVDVRLVAHHATERVAFSAFSVLGGAERRPCPAAAAARRRERAGRGRCTTTRSARSSRRPIRCSAAPRRTG